MNTTWDWKIEQQCPQCGAPIILDQTDRILTCEFCRTRVYLASKDHYRYFIPPAEDVNREKFFLPYLRMKGLCYTLAGTNISGRFFDTTALALNTAVFPSNLGLRPQALKLKFAGSEDAGKFLEPAGHNSKTIYSSHPSRAPKTSVTRNYLIGETVSVIYAPFYCASGYVYDAVLKEPLSPRVKEEEFKKLPFAAQKWNLNFIPLLCPHCGADMPGNKSALILFCVNCNNAWKSGNNGFEKINFSTYETSRKEVHYLPFWRIKANIEGIKLDSYADLISLANLPKAPSKRWEKIPFYFRTPAFKINPDLFLRWCKQMTASCSEEKPAEEVPAQSIYPVTLPAAEAAEAIAVILAGLIVDKKRLGQMIKTFNITIGDFLLELHPFDIGQKELIYSRSGTTIDKSALIFGQHI